MWIEFVIGPYLVLRLFLQVLWFSNLTTIQCRAPAKTDVASSLNIVAYLYHKILAWVVRKVDNTYRYMLDCDLSGG